MAPRPAFVKIISPHHSEKLKIPKAFASLMEDMGNKVTLRDCYRNSWEMDVVESKGGWYFEKGWAKFREDHSLQPGDIMVFRYKGDSLFKFMLFGKTKENGVRVRDLQHQLKEQEETMMDEERGEEVEEDEEPESDDGEDEDYIQVKVFVEGAEGEEPQPLYNVKRPGPRTSSWEKLGASPSKDRPKMPSFISKSRLGKRKNALYIPRQFLIDYQITIPEKVFLVDENGKRYETEVKKWKDGRFWCTKGWKTLSEENNIKWNDSCQCDLEQNQLGLDIHVRVIHDNEE